MSRLFVVFRTFDRIWACETYTRELAPFEMDISTGPIKLMFMIDHIAALPGSQELFALDPHCIGPRVISSAEAVSLYCHPHENFYPKILKHIDAPTVPDTTGTPMQSSTNVTSFAAAVTPTGGAQRGLVRRFSVPSLELDLLEKKTTAGHSSTRDVIYFVLPVSRCTIMMDAYLVSCMHSEYTRSRTFRRHFWHFLKSKDGFRNCIPDYERWTAEERDAWDNYLSVPYMIDIVAVWPKQKINYAWCRRILEILNKHVVLEEGFAWLSTLGGAHSSLGETFIRHAEQAGKISCQQLRLALELGNESLIARCYLFWAWSLLQRGKLRRCQICVMNTWKFCKFIRSRDFILENMCKAVWARLRYKRSLRRANRGKQATAAVKVGGENFGAAGRELGLVCGEEGSRGSGRCTGGSGSCCEGDDVMDTGSVSSIEMSVNVNTNSVVPQSLCVH